MVLIEPPLMMLMFLNAGHDARQSLLCMVLIPAWCTVIICFGRPLLSSPSPSKDSVIAISIGVVLSEPLDLLLEAVAAL